MKFFTLKTLILVLGISFSQNTFGQKKGNNKTIEIPKTKLIESYRSFKSDEASMIIDLLRQAVGETLNSKGYIIVYCGKVCQYGEVEAHLRGIKLSLNFKGVDERQFIVISGGFQKQTTTEFWLVPANACPPTPNSTIDFKDVKFKGTYKYKIVDYECYF